METSLMCFEQLSPLPSPVHVPECASADSVPLLELPMPIHQPRDKALPVVDRTVSTFVDVVNGDQVHPLEILSTNDNDALGRITKMLRRNPDVLRSLASAIDSPSLPVYLMEVAQLAVLSKSGLKRKQSRQKRSRQ